MDKLFFCEGACEQEFSYDFINNLKKHIGRTQKTLFIVRNKKNIKKIENLIKYTFFDYKFNCLYNVENARTIVDVYNLALNILYRFEIIFIENEQQLLIDDNYREIYVVGCEAEIAGKKESEVYPEGICELKTVNDFINITI